MGYILIQLVIKKNIYIKYIVLCKYIISAQNESINCNMSNLELKLTYKIKNIFYDISQSTCNSCNVKK